MKVYYLVFLCSVYAFAKPPALSNFGNSCYMNALLQALYNIRPMTEFIKDKENLFVGDRLAHAYATLLQNIQGNLLDFYKVVDATMEMPTFILSWHRMKSESNQLALNHQRNFILKELTKEKNKTEALFNNATNGQDKKSLFEKESFLKASIELITATTDNRLQSELTDLLTQFVAEKTLVMRQQDAADFLTTLLDKLTDTEKIQRPAIEFITKLLNPGLISTVRCPGQLPSVKEEPGLVLPIPIVIVGKEEEPTTLAACLNKFFSVEENIEFESRNDCSKQFRLKQASNFLIVQLKRFIADQYYRPLKLDDIVQIPFTFSFTDITLAGIKETYELIGVVIHAGDISSGHYTAYIKDQFEVNPQWYFCNDAQISGPLKDFEKQANPFEESGKPRSPTPYILFYKNKAAVAPEQSTEINIATPLHQLAQDLAALQKALV